ncbi:unnamed protein product [Urochloa humidicola]
MRRHAAPPYRSCRLAAGTYVASPCILLCHSHRQPRSRSTGRRLFAPKFPPLIDSPRSILLLDSGMRQSNRSSGRRLQGLYKADIKVMVQEGVKLIMACAQKIGAQHQAKAPPRLLQQAAAEDEEEDNQKK